MSSRRLLCVLACLSVVATTRAQGPRGLAPKPAPGTQWDPVFRDPSRIALKFVEGTRVRLRGQELEGDVDLGAVNALLAQATRIERLFERPEAVLDQEREALLRELPAQLDPPADLNNWYSVRTATGAIGARLIDALNALPLVEIAFAEHTAFVPCEPGDLFPPTPDFSAQQTYKDPAPTGIHQRATRVLPGGRGEALQVIDIESSWQLDHEDIPQLVQANVIGAHQMSLNPNHGVAVIGELACEHDEFGMTGIVDRTAVKVHSHQRQFWASSVDVAAANTPVGGFIVLEVQLSLNGRLTPMEVRQDVFDAVRNAVMAQKHVIAAAGNGSNNLDDPFFGGLFDPTTRDSGSVIVGATDGASLVRAGFSNYGSRVNVNGWGQRVATAGYGDVFNGNNDPRQYYTATFSGTSSATPIVTGAAMALAGAVLEQQGRRLTPAELRTLLVLHGTDVPNGQIGKRPDLVKLLAAVGLPSGLDILQDAGLGQTIQVELRGPARASWAVFAAFDRGFVDLGPIGRWLLDPRTAFLAFGGAVPAGGTVGIPIPVPNVANLRKVSLFLQGTTNDGSGFRLTNSVYNYVP
jgi:hypothetical protein